MLVSPRVAGGSIVAFDEGFSQLLVFSFGDNSLMVGTVKIRQLLADTCFIGALYLGTGKTANEGQGTHGQQDT